MGKGIVYCHVCGNRILQSDLDRGRAIEILKRNYCGKCKTGIEPASVAPVVTHQPGVRQTRRIPISRQKETRHALSRLHLTLIIAVGVFLLIALIVLIASRST